MPERLLFTENDSNMRRLDPNYSGPEHLSKDGFDRYLVHGEQNAVKEGNGTKCALLYRLQLEPGVSQTLYLRLVRIDEGTPGQYASEIRYVAETIVGNTLKVPVRFGANQCRKAKSHFESGAFNRALPPLRLLKSHVLNEM
jgi:hypothetical protein